LQPIRGAKAELNRRSQVCEVLAGTGNFASREMMTAKRENNAIAFGAGN